MPRGMYSRAQTPTVQKGCDEGYHTNRFHARILAHDKNDRIKFDEILICCTLFLPIVELSGRALVGFRMRFFGSDFSALERDLNELYFLNTVFFKNKNFFIRSKKILIYNSGKSLGIPWWNRYKSRIECEKESKKKERKRDRETDNQRAIETERKRERNKDIKRKG